jgi:hypothetical protein
MGYPHQMDAIWCYLIVFHINIRLIRRIHGISLKKNTHFQTNQDLWKNDHMSEIRCSAVLWMVCLQFPYISIIYGAVAVARISTTLRCQRWQLFESPQPWNFGNRPQVMGKIEFSNFTNCWYIELPNLTSLNHYYGKYKPSKCGWCFYCFNNKKYTINSAGELYEMKNR